MAKRHSDSNIGIQNRHDRFKGPYHRESCHEIYLFEDRFRDLKWQTIFCARTKPVRIMPQRTKDLMKFLTERRERWIRKMDPRAY